MRTRSELHHCSCVPSVMNRMDNVPSRRATVLVARLLRSPASVSLRYGE